LWRKIELARPRLQASCVQFWTRDDLKLAYPRFLLELHQIMLGGLAIMRLALQRSRELARADAVAAAAAEYLARHIDEEKDHDAWLLSDMAVCGITAEKLRSQLPGAEVSALLGAQAFWILQEHPVAVFGYLAVVEGDPPTHDHLEEMRIKTRYAQEAFRCLREHADADVVHQAELRAAIDGLPLEARHHQLLALSAFETIAGLTRLFDVLSRARAGGEA
jgi:hypothetical protein